MTSDLYALVATLALAMAQLALASILTLRQLGPAWALGPRDDQKSADGIAGRIVRAHRNLLEIFPQFLAALFLVHAAHATGTTAGIGAWIFFIARCLYVPAYALGPLGARPACWLAAQAGIVLILINLFF